MRRSGEDLAHFDSGAIVEALVREANLDLDLATQISIEVRRFIQKLGFRALNSSLIRGLVDAKLLELGLEEAYGHHTRLGVPLFDVDGIIRNEFSGSGFLSRGPDGTSLMMGEAIKREYAIKSVFSEPVSNAHLIGDIHIHNIGDIDRPYSLTSSIDHVKQFGLTPPHGFNVSGPARRAEVLISHLAKLSGSLRGYFSGPIAWDSVNFGVAPFLTGLDYGVIKQLAQTLIFEVSASAVSRGGRTAVVDMHVDWDAPPYLVPRAAIGPGGKATAKSYREYSAEARRFLQALLEVMIEGDALGRPFVTSTIVLHVNSHFNEIPGYRFVLEMAGRLAAERGGLTVAFDRDDDGMFFRRYGISGVERPNRTQTHGWRSARFQAVSLNLVRAGYLAGGNQVRVLEELTRLMEIAAQAHLEKRIFLERLLAAGEQGTLGALTIQSSGEPFLKLGWSTHSIGPTGLSELCRCVLGSDLQDSEASMQFALKLLSHLKYEAERLSSKHNVAFLLSGETSELTAHRMAALDLRFFGQAAAAAVRGEPAGGSAYYTDGPRLASGSDVLALDRLRTEGRFHSHGFSNVASEIWVGENSPNADEMGRLISQAFFQTQCSAVVFCPEFTICKDCGRCSRGLREQCAKCGSARVDGLAYTAGGYGYTSSWDPARRLELRSRKRVVIGQ